MKKNMSRSVARVIILKRKPDVLQKAHKGKERGQWSVFRVLWKGNNRIWCGFYFSPSQIPPLKSLPLPSCGKVWIQISTLCLKLTSNVYFLSNPMTPPFFSLYFAFAFNPWTTALLACMWSISGEKHFKQQLQSSFLSDAGLSNWSQSKYSLTWQLIPVWMFVWSCWVWTF